jgi:hypothetical protein
MELERLELKLRTIELKMARDETSSVSDDSLSEVLQTPVPEAGVNRAAFIERWLEDESMPECSITPTPTPVNVKKKIVPTGRQFCASRPV